MVIMFRGTNISRNNAPQTLALFAGLTVVKFGRKTLILQFSTNYSVEEYLIGKQIKDQAIHSEINMFDDVGIDAMLRRVETQKIDAKHFSTFSQELYAEPNMFDLAQRSKKEDFEEEIVTRERDIAKLLGYAKEVYDDIYILVNGKKDKVVEMMNKLVDISFVCVPQGNVQEHTAMSDKSKILVTNFDSRSSYDLKSMQKRYGVGEIASVPFNVTFRDFCYSNNLIRFIMTNDKVGPGDDNYALFYSVSSIIEKIHDGELMELRDPAFNFEKKKSKVESPEEKIHYSEKNIKKEVKRKGFFRKREEVTVHFSETGFNEASSSIAEPDSSHRKKRKDPTINKKKGRFGRMPKNAGKPDQEAIDPESYEEFSDLEDITKDLLSEDSFEDDEDTLEDSTEEEDEDFFEEITEEDSEEEEDFSEEDTEEEDEDLSDEVTEEEDNSAVESSTEEDYYEEDAPEADEEPSKEDTEEEDNSAVEDAEEEDCYEEDTPEADEELSKEDTEDETSAASSQSQAKKQQELLDYIRKYCEDRKYRLSESDLISISQKPYVLDYYDGWKKEYVATMWKEFVSIPVDPHTDAIMDNWEEFPAGTGSEVIKSWFIFNYGTDIMNSIMPKNTGKKKTAANPRKRNSRGKNR